MSNGSTIKTVDVKRLGEWVYVKQIGPAPYRTRVRGAGPEKNQIQKLLRQSCFDLGDLVLEEQVFKTNFFDFLDPVHDGAVISPG